MTTNNQLQTEDEFYTGYATMPQGVKRFLQKFIPFLVLGVLIFGMVLPLVHDHFLPSRAGKTIEFEGLLLSDPLPHLVVPRKGDTTSGTAYSRYVLSGRGKTAVKPAILENNVGKFVKLQGSPIYRDNHTLVTAKSAEAIDTPDGSPVKPNAGESLGKFSLNGELVDSKCYLGTMKPGQTKTHRACAIRCISGGVPPALLVRNEKGDAMYFVLVDSEGKAVNSRVRGAIAEQVRITGEVVQYDDLFVLKADPETYELL